MHRLPYSRKTKWVRIPLVDWSSSRERVLVLEGVVNAEEEQTSGDNENAPLSKHVIEIGLGVIALLARIDDTVDLSITFVSVAVEVFSIPLVASSMFL